MLSRMFSAGAEAPMIDYPINGGETQKQVLSRKLLSPESFGQCANSVISSKRTNGINGILSAGATGNLSRGPKSSEKLMDRFIPCRLGENL